MLRAGFGCVDITPLPGCCLQGYFRRRVSEKVLDPLFARAVVAENGSGRVCLASCDLIGIGPREVEEARRLVSEKAGIAGDRIIICATHTHTGPVTRSAVLPGRGEDRDEKWLALLPAMICSAVLKAAGSMEETGFACRSGFEDRVSFNRRFLMDDGTVKTNPGIGNPGVVRPAGPIDAEVGVLAFGRSFSSPLGAAVNFALHLDTVGGTGISADFPGVIRNYLEKVYGGIGFVYTSGAMGNINHRDVMNGAGKKYEYFEQTSRIGRILAGEIVKTISRIEEFSDDVSVGGGAVSVELPLKDYDDNSLKRAEKVLSDTPADLNSSEYMSAVAALRSAALGRGKYTARLAALRIGDAAMVSIPGEYFTELGLEIKNKSPFPQTFVAELGLDSLGYIATREAYGQGGYEPMSSPLAPGCGEALRDAALELLETLE